jgi:hypothetical protein
MINNKFKEKAICLGGDYSSNFVSKMRLVSSVVVNVYNNVNVCANEVGTNYIVQDI